MNQKLAIGIIRTSFGVHGELKVKSLSGETDHFLELSHISIEKNGQLHEYRIEGIKIKSDVILLKLEGIDTPEKGKEFNGCKIWVDREKACPLEDDEYYYGDLTHCEVFKANIRIGKVMNVFESGSDFMLELRSTNGKQLILPLRDEYIEDIDIKQCVITLREESEMSEDFS
ncbi:MAG: 16S rRNA processing protein RimM [Spirochaetales bacterium]|nr:16S rRNA processing protein RimM [Spirochaetales bacterium]